MILPLGAKAPFTAIPRTFVDLDHLNDGEFRTLVLICMHADAETGECIVKQRTLASMMGKSTPAISAHVKALREAGLLETDNLRNDYGGNSHLQYRVPFWPKWQAHLRNRKSAKVIQPAECPIQPAECYKESNQILDNHSPSPAVPDVAETLKRPTSPLVDRVVDEIIEMWKVAVGPGNGCYGVFAQRPAPDLVAKTEHILAVHRPESSQTAAMPEVIQDRLQAIWRSLDVAVTQSDVSEQAQNIMKVSADPLPLLDRLSESIRRTWKRYWRRPPLPRQFQQFLAQAQEQAPDASLATKLRLLAGNLRRYHKAYGGCVATT